MVPLLHHLRRQPLFLYVLSEVLAIMMGSTRWKAAAYAAIHSGITDAYLASAVYALVFTLFLGCIGYPLYLKKYTSNCNNQFIIYRELCSIKQEHINQTKLNSMLNVQSLTQRTFAQIVVFALLLLNSTLAFAQNQVNGIVTDKTGEPLIGVNVVEKVLPTVLSLTLTDSLH